METAILNGVGVLMVLWGLFYPHPYGIVIAIGLALPVIAVMIAGLSLGYYRFSGRISDGRPNLTGLFVLPGGMLMARACFDIQIIDWKRTVIFAGVVASILTLAAMATDRGLRRSGGTAACLALLCLAYGYGGVVEINELLDNSRPTIYQATVTGKHVTSGSRSPRERTLQVTSWGPHSGANPVRATPSVYEDVDVGDTICIVTRPGALGLSWFFPARCGYK